MTPENANLTISDMNEKDLQKQLDQQMKAQNNRAIADFEGYSPLEMRQIMYDTFGAESPLQLKKATEADYRKVPLLNQVKYLCGLIEQSGELKLTAKGFLPTKIVADIYQQGFMKEMQFEKGISKLYKETDSLTINLTRLLIEIAGLVKKRQGKLSLTKKGTQILADDQELLRLLLLTFATKFNWAYYDGYGENQIGQLGYGFSLILLSKYGAEKRLESFYAERYFRAFPQLLQSIQPTSYRTPMEYATGCYAVRTFERFLDYFGWIEIEHRGMGFDRKTYISKTDLFDCFIQCLPHGTGR